MKKLLLTGAGLSCEDLRDAGVDTKIAIDDGGRHRLEAARAVIDKAVAEGTPVYGLNTGLGARVGEALSPDQAAEFSYRTVRGRAHAVGPAMAASWVRAAMIVRLNGFLKGAAGVSPSVAQGLLDVVNRGLTPVIGEVASIGAGDLIWGATMAHALIGEGEIMDAAGNRRPAAEALCDAGIAPLTLGPRDGLVLANHSSFTGALAALAVAGAGRLIDTVLLATALSYEGFRANLGPLDPRVIALRPQPGQAEAAERLRALLQDGDLTKPGAARRLQDPLSLRNAAQGSGAALAALAFARTSTEDEINGASDNPLVLLDGEVLSSGGGYFTPMIAIAMDTLSRSLAHLAVMQLARMSKMLAARYTELPLFLALPGAVSNGFAPLMKVAEALCAEMLHLSQPVPVWPSVNADGAEDALTNASLAAKNLLTLLEKARLLCAIELMVAAQAIDLRNLGDAIAPRLAAVHGQIRAISPALGDDRPLTGDLEQLAELIETGGFDQA